MIKKSGNKNIKIIAATSMVIFTLFASFSAAFAWFTGIRQNQEAVDTMKVSPVTGQLKSLSIHTLKETGGFSLNEQGAITGYNFNTEAVSTINMNWQKGEPDYSTSESASESESVAESESSYSVSTPSLGLYTLTQPTNPLLLVFELNQATAANKVTISATASKKYQPSEYQSLANETSNPLSWVVKATSKVVTSNAMAVADYSIAKEDLSGEAHFAVTNNNGDVTSFDQTVKFYQGTGDTQIKFVCIVLDYYEPAMEYFFAVNLGKSFVEDSSKIVPFKVDWTMVI